MSTEIIRPQRSMSYNDIKKRRMLRQSKSKGKLKCSQASTQVVQTQKKVHQYQMIDMYAGQRPNQVDEMKQIANKKLNSYQIEKQTVKRISQPNFTDRFEYNKNAKMFHFNASNNQQEKAVAYSRSKQIIKDLIEQSKSERRLIKYKQLRNQYKLSKSRSNSKSVKSLAEKSRVLARKLISVDFTPEKPIDSNLRNIKNSLRVKRFQSVNEGHNQNGDIKNSFRYLVSAPRMKRDNQQVSKGLKIRNKQLKLQDQIQSSIQIQKQSSMFDSQDDKFLQQMCLKGKMKKQIKSQQQKQKYKQKQKQQNKLKLINLQKINSQNKSSTENILDLLDVEQEQLSKVINKKQRQKKILHDLQKLNKKFPKGFFKI